MPMLVGEAQGNRTDANTQYFRSDFGRAKKDSGPLPARLDDPSVLRWRVNLDSGQSTPILSNGRIFLTTYNNQSKELATVALDQKTGELIWRQPLTTGSIEAFHQKTGNAAVATPACDGSRLYVFFGSYGLICYDLDGKKLSGYDPSNGKLLWSIPGLARIVIPMPVPDGDMIYMASWAPGGDSGKRLTLDVWPTALGKWDKNKDGRLSLPEIDDREVVDRFFRMDLDQNGTLDSKEWDRHANVFRLAQNAILAVKPSGRGELPGSQVVWKHQRGIPYVATPLLDSGIIWMVKDGGIVTKLEASSGALLQEERLAGLGGYYSSPVTGDSKVYFASEAGVVTVVENKRDWQVLSSHDFHEKIYCSPVIDGSRIYVRTDQALHAFDGSK